MLPWATRADSRAARRRRKGGPRLGLGKAAALWPHTTPLPQGLGVGIVDGGSPGYVLPITCHATTSGGTPWGWDAAEEGLYVNTTYAHHGMRGSELAVLPTGVVWRAGGVAEVAMQIRFNHGGGYQYRLCPADEPLTESCFQGAQHPNGGPLPFVRNRQALLFPNGTRFPLRGTFVDQGVVPPGSTWSMVPLPPTGEGPRCSCSPDPHTYKPLNYDCGCKVGEEVDSCVAPGNCSAGACLPCPETPGSDCSRCDNHGGAVWVPPCPGCTTPSALNPTILDELEVPSRLPPGKYVLGFRYDCEATSQVWSSCADIEIAA